MMINEPSRMSDLLLTDLYEFAMLEAYQEASMTATAVFEFFVRKLPVNRGFLVAAGLEQVVEFLRTARFDDQDLDLLRDHAGLGPKLLDHLASFRFSGDVHAVPEGTVFFPDEPILRVCAPITEAQLVETRIINLLHFQTVIASKAARMVMVAEGKPLVDFGLRRAHGAEAGLLAARASYLAGFAGTATTPAAARFGMPIYGTLAHSFIQAHDREEDAFLNFARTRPEGAVFLIDTYDTEAGARKVVALADQLRARDISLRAVRIDSGDLARHAENVRRILDEGGLNDVSIIASGGIDEFSLARFAACGAPIDSYGIGTSLTTSQDAPALDCAYKLQEYNGVAKRKRSEGKATWPGRKQVFRTMDEENVMTGDILCLDHEEQSGIPLVEPVMRQGELVAPLPSLEDIRQRTAKQLAMLPQDLRALKDPSPYMVEISRDLRNLADEVDLQTAAEQSQTTTKH